MFNHTALVHEMGNLEKFAMKLTKNSSDKSDLLQATLLRALEKKDLFEDGTNLFKWTSKIMYNLFVSDYRHKVKFETQYDPETYIDQMSVAPTQAVETELSEVEDAIGRLSDDHQSILKLVCIDGLQYAEVSEALQIPVGTVRSRLFRARESLSYLLNEPHRPRHMRAPLHRKPLDTQRRVA